MEPLTPNPGLNEIRGLEFSAISQRNNLTKLYAKHAVQVDLYEQSKIDTSKQRMKVDQDKQQYGKIIELRKELFKARNKPNVHLPINENDKKAEIAWRYEQNYKKIVKNKDQIKNDLTKIHQNIRIAEASLNEQIDLIATKYVQIGSEPAARNPLFKEINLRIAFIKSQTYKELNQEDLAKLDKHFDPLFEDLIQDASLSNTSTPCSSLLKLIDLFKTSPEYTVRRLSKIGGDNSLKIVNMIMRELMGNSFIAELAKAALIYELENNNTNTFLRSGSVNELLIKNYQEISLAPILNNLIESIRDLVKDDDLEIDPKKNLTTVESNKEKLMGFVILALKKINQSVKIQKLIPLDLREMYNLIHAKRGNQGVASFFFLRFFCPELIVKQKDDPPKLERNLVLMSILLTSLVNNQQSNVEWMEFFGSMPLKSDGQNRTLLVAGQDPINSIARNLMGKSSKTEKSP